MSSADTDRGNIAGIDGLRAVAVVEIVVFHLHRSLMPGGFVGLDIFYVISSFVVALSVRRTQFDSFGSHVIWFYRRRLMWIYPILILFLLSGFAFWALFVSDGYEGSDTVLVGLASFLGLSNIMLWLRTGSYFGMLSEYNIFTHTW